MKLKKIRLALAVIAVGSGAVLFGLFASGIPGAHDEYVADYNEGVRNFMWSADFDRDDLFLAAQDKFQEALFGNPPNKVRAATLYNIATASLHNMQRTGDATEAEIEMAIASLKEAGRYASGDMDIKRNLDILLGIKALSLDKAGGADNVVPLPNLDQGSIAREADAENSETGDKFDKNTGNEPAGANPEPDF